MKHLDELHSARQLGANILTRLGYEPFWQDIFGTEAGDLRQMLRDKIDSCNGVIHLVGFGYGAEPAQPDPDFGRVSYTQYEYLYAKKTGKKTWILFVQDGFPADLPPDQLDLPPAGHRDPEAYRPRRTPRLAGIPGIVSQEIIRCTQVMPESGQTTLLAQMLTPQSRSTRNPIVL